MYKHTIMYSVATNSVYIWLLYFTHTHSTLHDAQYNWPSISNSVTWPRPFWRSPYSTGLDGIGHTTGNDWTVTVSKIDIENCLVLHSYEYIYILCNFVYVLVYDCLLSVKLNTHQLSCIHTFCIGIYRYRCLGLIKIV